MRAAALVYGPAATPGEYSSLSAPLLNAAGEVAFHADLMNAHNTRGIFAGKPGSVKAVALLGNAAPGGGTYAGSGFGSFTLNNAGQVAFTANLVGSGITPANDRALYAGMPGALHRVIREGDVIDIDPGIGVTNRTVESFIYGGGFNDAGLIVYSVRFTSGGGGVFMSQIPEPATLAIVFAGCGVLLSRAGFARTRANQVP